MHYSANALRLLMSGLRDRRCEPQFFDLQESYGRPVGFHPIGTKLYPMEIAMDHCQAFESMLVSANRQRGFVYWAERLQSNFIGVAALEIRPGMSGVQQAAVLRNRWYARHSRTCPSLLRFGILHPRLLVPEGGGGVVLGERALLDYTHECVLYSDDLQRRFVSDTTGPLGRLNCPASLVVLMPVVDFERERDPSPLLSDGWLWSAAAYLRFLVDHPSVPVLHRAELRWAVRGHQPDGDDVRSVSFMFDEVRRCHGLRVQICFM
jgi:hypothetical protein